MLYLCTDIHDVFCINGKKIIIDMGSQKKKLLSKSKSRGLLIVAIAAVLIELLSGVQYYHTHLIIEEQLEKRAESELMMKGAAHCADEPQHSRRFHGFRTLFLSVERSSV